MITYSAPYCEGVITALLARGAEVSDIREADTAVVQVLQGENSGKYIVVSLDDAEIEPFTYS